MADQDIFSCGICFQNYQLDKHIPKIISHCGHTLCSECLDSILNKARSKGHFQCPFDKKDIIITPTVSFPRNFSLIQILEARQLKKGFFGKAEKCPLHDDELKLICMNERTQICTECAFGSEHLDHQILTGKQFIEKVQSKVTQLDQYLNITAHEDVLTLSQMREAFTQKKNQLREEVNSGFAQLVQMLFERQESVLSELDKVFEEISSENNLEQYISNSAEDYQRNQSEAWLQNIKDKVHDWNENRNYQVGFDLFDQEVDQTIWNIKKWLEKRPLATLTTKINSITFRWSTDFIEKCIAKVGSIDFQKSDFIKPKPAWKPITKSLPQNTDPFKSLGPCLPKASEESKFSPPKPKSSIPGNLPKPSSTKIKGTQRYPKYPVAPKVILPKGQLNSEESKVNSHGIQQSSMAPYNGNQNRLEQDFNAKFINSQLSTILENDNSLIEKYQSTISLFEASLFSFEISDQACEAVKKLLVSLNQKDIIAAESQYEKLVALNHISHGRWLWMFKEIILHVKEKNQIPQNAQQIQEQINEGDSKTQPLLSFFDTLNGGDRSILELILNKIEKQQEKRGRKEGLKNKKNFTLFYIILVFLLFYKQLPHLSKNQQQYFS